MKYQNLDDSIKPHVERKDVKGNDTFDISDRWVEEYADQKTSYVDYMELSIQSQF